MKIGNDFVPYKVIRKALVNHYGMTDPIGEIVGINHGIITVRFEEEGTIVHVDIPKEAIDEAGEILG